MGGGFVAGLIIIGVLRLSGGTSPLGGVVQQSPTSAFACLPSDFPVYPGESFFNEAVGLNPGATPGNVCQKTFHSSDPPDTVYAFFAAQLNTGDWKVMSSNSSTRKITFISAKHARTNGNVAITFGAGFTQILVYFYVY